MDTGLGILHLFIPKARKGGVIGQISMTIDTKMKSKSKAFIFHVWIGLFVKVVAIVSDTL